jgi:hypothetical protein
MVNESVRYAVRWFGVVGLSMALSECIHSDSAMDSIVSPEDGQGTPETCRDLLNKIISSDIKLDTHTHTHTHIYIYIYSLYII